MSLKDVMAADISAVFLNPDEFAETHSIDGVNILAVVDSDVIRKREGKVYDGVFREECMLFVKESDLGYRPTFGQAMRLDDEYYLVAACNENAGMLEITLGVNAS